MPGITLWLNTKGVIKERHCKAQNKMLFDQRYESFTLISASNLFIGYVKYPHYPLQKIETDRFIIIIEGAVYNRTTAEIEQLFQRLTSKTDINETLTKWIKDADGDFIVFVYDRREDRIYIANDRLGRLPIYYKVNDYELILARECKYIREVSADFSLDVLGCAEYSWAGMPLGDRTIYKGIKYLPPASILNASTNRSTINCSLTSELVNYQDKKHRHKPYRIIVRDLVDLWLEVIKARCRFSLNQTLMALSGGMDSRAVASGLAYCGKKFQAVSYIDELHNKYADWKVANRIAQKLAVKFKSYPRDEVNEGDYRRLFRMKDGMNYIAAAFFMKFLDRLLADFPLDYCLYTGDGGPQALNDVRPSQRLHSIDEVVKAIGGYYANPQLDLIEDVFYLSRGTLKDSIYDLVKRFPEPDPALKYVHFMISQRAQKWGYEGEDRNRFYFWQMSPFYAQPFFNYCMNINDDFKKHRALFRSFHIALSPQVAGVDYTAFRMPISSPMFALKVRLAQAKWLKPYRVIKRKLRQKSDAPFSIDKDQRLKIKINGDNDLVNTEKLVILLEQIDDFQYWNWRTVGMVIRDTSI